MLPPINSISGFSPERSPYRVALDALVQRYATSEKRQKILGGFLCYRAELHAIGLVRGFQWLDGSFLEQVEVLENRPPNDMDVVTFSYMPTDESQETLLSKNSRLFNPRTSKTDYWVDGYVTFLGPDELESLVERMTYWYSLWSHRRNQAWKGFLQIDLAPDKDANAKEILNAIENNGDHP